MATEFPDDPEVDLGFRDAGSELSSDGHDEKPIQTQYKPFVSKRLKASPPALSARWWLLRILLVIALSAGGGLISSIFFFNDPERFTVLRHLIRETYILPPAVSEAPAANLAEFSIDRVPTYQIGNDLGAGVPNAKPSPGLDPTVPFLSQWLSPGDLHRFVQDASPFAAPQSAEPPLFFSGAVAAATAPPDLTDETQTRSAVRSALEKASVRKAALRRRSAHHFARKIRPKASFWSLWSRHFLASGTAAATTRRRSSKRESRSKKAKQSFWLASSWRAIASQPKRPRSRPKSVIRSRTSAVRGLQPAMNPPPIQQQDR
jgi:hypothetical protein